MIRRHGVAVTAVGLALACAALAGCGGAKVTIPDDAGVSTDRYTLLYSTLGYDAAGTKRVLIRQTDPGAPVSEGIAFTWKLADEDGNEKAKGRAAFAGTAWGIPLWLADFSEVDDAGVYRLVVEAPDIALVTDPFRIEPFALYRQTFASIAMEGMEAREAPVELDFGYYDGNTRAGDAAAHASLLVGLIEGYERRRGVMNQAQRERLQASITRAVDYLVLLTDAATGEARPRSDTRPFGRNAPYESAEVARALARYAVAFGEEERDKADRVFRRVVALDGLLDQTPAEYPATYRTAVRYDLYQYGGNEAHLEGAVAAARELESYDLRTMQRFSRDGTPHVEGLYRMWKGLPDHPERAAWEATARRIAGQHLQMLLMNAFHFVPPGADTVDGITAARQWDEVATLLPPGDGDPAIVSNAWFLGRAVDALYLMEMTGEEQLEQAAAGSIGWVSGLNAGVASQRVHATGSAGALRPAAFVTGVGGSAMTWSEWEWQRPRTFASVATGFRGGLVYDDAFETGETSIANDGRWLHAITLYEDMLDAERRAPTIGGPPPVTGAHVASASATVAGEVLQMAMRIVGPDGAPLVGARVVVIWQAQHSPEIDPADAVQSSECITATDGECLTVVRAADIPGPRPVTASVTNVEHPEFPWDIASDDPSRTVTLP